ncbi:MAG: hypothetical protein Q7K55_04175 [Candidatus Levybacteria bacterium]|nr:hypothetical protein [Candidatus Levybacteria bacterium]
MTINNITKFIRKYIVEIALITFSLIFSSWLMFSTFSYDNGHMLIASKAWSDFGSHIPLIRSFSYGVNFPPQYPLFPGEPIKYHFIFYALVGIIEKTGLRIDFALNILSILGFASLILMIYFFTKKLFSSKAIAVLSAIFFLFNGTLSFIYFLKEHSLSLNFINEIITNSKFPSFAPYGDGVVSAFWNLNIYTNQRHLAMSYALSLLILYIFLLPMFKNLPAGKAGKKINYKTSILLGIVLGLSYFFHMAVFLMTIIIIFSLSILIRKLKFSGLLILIFAGLFAFPQYYWQQTNGAGIGSSKINFNPGYLISNSLNFGNFINYWFANLGLHFILIPLGFIFSPLKSKKILIAFLTLFIIGNLFQFSLEIAANHKFFNYFMIIGNMFSAFFLVFIWKKNILLRPLVCIFIFLLIFSGIIDFFPIYNDYKISLADYPVNKDISWIMKNTSSNTIFLNSSYLYDSASLAGRKIFFGWPYFAWSQGYNTLKRSEEIKSLFEEKDKKNVCKYLIKHNLSYVSLTNPSNDFPFDRNFWQENFKPVYSDNKINSITIYDTKASCNNI